jgi:hypothetical protein
MSLNEIGESPSVLGLRQTSGEPALHRLRVDTESLSDVNLA